MLLELENLSSGYGHFPVLREVSLAVAVGEIVTLVGANGAGKSTLLNTVMGLVSRLGGEIRLDCVSITRAQTPAIVRAGVAQVPERRQLFGTMTIEENLLMGAYTSSDQRTTLQRLEEQFERFPVLRERRRQAAQTLSGGQQQMLAIARAMMSAPRLLLLDEPSLGLAPLIVSQMFSEIMQLRSVNSSVLLVEQNAHAALSIADRGYVLENGRIVASGTARELSSDAAVRDAYLGGQAGQFAIERSIRRKKSAILQR